MQPGAESLSRNWYGTYLWHAKVVSSRQKYPYFYASLCLEVLRQIYLGLG